MQKIKQSISKIQVNQFFRFFYCIILLALYTFLSGDISEHRFVILHIDGVSSNIFFREYREGNLPNLRQVFNEEGIIPHTITLFPGETEMIVPRMRTGQTSREGEFVAWGHYDREKRVKTTKRQIFFYLADILPRRARSGFYYGLPGYHLAAGPAMVNIADLIHDYQTVHFYWFSTDTFGHFGGEKALLKQLYRFDRYFGKLVKNLDEEVNIIIYSDHGMTFNEAVPVNMEEELEKVLNDEIIAFFKPNIYLENPERKPEAAREIAHSTAIDFAFFQKDEKNVVGFYRENTLKLSEKNGFIQYLFEGKDPFSYDKLGYSGEHLSPDQWLELTYNAQYPASIPLIYWYVQNDHTGDIVVFLDYPKIPSDLFYILSAHHSGLRDTDLSVPVLLKGKEVEHLYDRDFLWLHRLYKEIPSLNVGGIKPERERHELSIWGSHSSRRSYRGAELYYSPAYRWKIAGRIDRRGQRIWGERDFFSSYLTRFWAGLGAQYIDSDLEPVFSLKHEIRYRKISSRLQYFRSYRHQDSYCAVLYNFTPNVAFSWIVPKGFGITLSW